MQGQRILLVSAGMGAGHDQCARELARRFAERGAEVRVVDLLALLPLRLGPALRGFYGGMLAHAPWLYSVIYRVFMATMGAPGPGRQRHGRHGRARSPGWAPARSHRSCAISRPPPSSPRSTWPARRWASCAAAASPTRRRSS
ncbi:hypothetical protein [Tomitella gaofuii]|uniref:hypothetical protein n=1 Tax=Tomitella gaofuii TaxID=2760083 RepID=UPI0015FD4CB4|nr:hypothetical protein [Tomitella gaofuii]